MTHIGQKSALGHIGGFGDVSGLLEFQSAGGDDFLEADNLALAAALARKGADFELFDPKPRRHETLGHVFVIGMPWLDESVECFERLRRFSYERC